MSAIAYRFFKAPREKIHLLKAILESYEGACILSTVDREQGIIQVLIAGDFLEEMEAVLKEINESIPLYPVYTDIAHSLGNF